ncbi:MAG: lysyl oxidase family protein [Pirellulales bacterium]
MSLAVGRLLRNRLLLLQRKSRSIQLSRPSTRRLRIESLESRELLHAGHPVAEISPAPVTVVSAPVVAAALTPQSLLPDLTPWLSQARGFVYDWTIQGNELRLTTAMANIGTGPMELRGGATRGSTQDVYQRIYEPDGTFTDVLAGTFTYHPEHGHIHFDGFAQFRLRSVLADGGVGPIVAAGDKVSFCLLDVERYDNSGPSSPFYLTCGQIQGISAGWADIYDRGLPGQSIDISTVPNGNYWLEVVVDPDNHLTEANEANNAAQIQINLQRSDGGGAIPPDAFEPNNSFAAASILAPPEDHVYSSLSIHASQDFDVYRVTASASGSMAFRLAFQHSQGDIDMEVYDSTQTRLGLSDSTDNSEQFTFAAVAGQFYYVRAYGFQGATNPNYTLTVDQPDGTSGGPADQFEENDTFATAYNLSAVDQTYTGLSINATNDDDYYRIVPTVSGIMSVSLAFQHAQGDIDMQILSASQTQLGLSDSTGNGEQFSLSVTAGPAYYIRVYGFRGAINPSYSMTINVPETPSGGTGDALEENDTFATARSLTAVDQVYSNLSINAPNDDDYYSIVPTNSGTLTVSVAFQHAQGDIDMRIYNASQSQLGLSDSTSNAEQLSLTVTAGQTYYIRVYGFQGDTNPSYTMTVAVPSAPVPGASSVYYLSTTGGGSLASTNGAPALSFTDADILKLTVQSNGQYQYELHFDGSDVGLTTSSEDIDAFAFLTDGSVLISTVGSFSVPAPGGGSISGGGVDLLRFMPTSLGAATAGAWSIYFDGSDVGLSGSAENIDAVAALSDGSLLISVTGAPSVTGASGQDEDLLRFIPTSLGSTTAGSWSMYFDGSDVGLATNAGEDVNALYVRETTGNPTLFFSTLGNFSVTGASGANEDAFAFTPTTLGSATAGTFGPGLAFDGSLYGLSSFSVDGIHLVPPASPLAASAQSSTLRASAPALASAVVTSQRAPVHQTQRAHTAETRTRSTSTLLNTVLSSPKMATSAVPTAVSCGCRSANVATLPEKNGPVFNGLTVWDHLAQSLDDLFRTSALR